MSERYPKSPTQVQVHSTKNRACGSNPTRRGTKELMQTERLVQGLQSKKQRAATYGLTRSRRQNGAIKDAFLASNPELYWEGGGETPHSVAIMLGFEFSCKPRRWGRPSLTRENAGDTFAALWRKCRQSRLTEGNALAVEQSGPGSEPPLAGGEHLLVT